MHPAAARVADLYDRHARAWDRDRGRSLPERAWLDRFRALAGAGASVLDLGCGSAEPVAGYLIEAGHRLTGADASPAMIALCRRRFPDHAWIVADMRRLDLGARFGGVLAWDSLFHLPPAEQRAVIPRLCAHAASGAALMFTSGPAGGEAIGRFRGEPLYHASLDPGEYVALLGARGARVVRHAAEDPGCGGRTVWLARAG